MSKSLGNGVDPMDVIAKHGVDSLRFFLTTLIPRRQSGYGATLRKLEASWKLH